MVWTPSNDGDHRSRPSGNALSRKVIALPRFMLDTNVFNRILDGAIPVSTLAGRVEA